MNLPCITANQCHSPIRLRCACETFLPKAMLNNSDEQMNALHPKKLLLTKWTAVKPIAKNKHFLVSKVIEPELPEVAI